MNILEKSKKESIERKDKKYIGKRYMINYSDIIPSYNILSEDENTIKSTVLEYLGKGIYKDLLTNFLIQDNLIFDTNQEIDFQFNLFNINKFLKEIKKEDSETFIQKITETQRENINDIIIKARIKSLKNALEEIKEDEIEIDNNVKSLQK
ncbi:MAG: hypothetical protein IKF91_03475 [Bacilli bacterium]|nr:hypothetical protein [Bacilli bacterium]